MIPFRIRLLGSSCLTIEAAMMFAHHDPHAWPFGIMFAVGAIFASVYRGVP